MKSYDLLVLVVFIPEGRPQQRILLLGGRLAKLASDLVRVFASLDGGRRFLRQFGSRQDRPLAGRVIAASTAGRPAGGHVAAAIGATAQDGSVATGHAPTPEALIGGRAYTASGDSLLLRAHDFVEVFQGLVEDTFSLGGAAHRAAAAGAIAGPGALLSSGSLAIAFEPAATSLTGIAALAAVAFRAVAAIALTARLDAVLAGTFRSLAANTLDTLSLTAGLTRIAALTVSGSVLTLGIALLTARLAASAVTLTARLGALRTAGRGRKPTTRGREPAAGRWHPTAGRWHPATG